MNFASLNGKFCLATGLHETAELKKLVEPNCGYRHAVRQNREPDAECRRPLDIEQEVANVTIIQHIILALDAQLPDLAQSFFCFVFLEIFQ